MKRGASWRVLGAVRTVFPMPARSQRCFSDRPGSHQTRSMIVARSKQAPTMYGTGVFDPACRRLTTGERARGGEGKLTLRVREVLMVVALESGGDDARYRPEVARSHVEILIFLEVGTSRFDTRRQSVNIATRELSCTGHGVMGDSVTRTGVPCFGLVCARWRDGGDK